MAAGIGEGDRVALLSRTRYEWTVVDYALWAAGAVTVPVYETSSAEQVEWILTDSGAQAIVVETPAASAGDRRGAAAAAGRAADVADRGRRGGRPVARRAGGRGRRDRRGRPRPAPDVGRGRGLRHDHLHLGHHRPPEGVRDHPRQPAGQRAQRRPRAAVGGLRHARRLDAALPSPRALVRAPHRGRRHGGGCRTRPHPRPGDAAAGPGHVPAHVPSRRPPGVREGLQRRGAAGVGKRGQERDLPRGGQDGYRLEPRARHRRRALARRAQRARPPAAAPACRLRPPGLPQAPRRGRRPGALLGVRRRCRSGNGSAISSAVRGSPSSRGTGSPRPPPPPR